MTPATVTAECASCHCALLLDCEGLPGFWGYETQNEYLCSECGKRNYARSPGAIVSVRAA